MKFQFNPLLFLILLFPFLTHAQTVGDAVRYSSTQNLGSARFVAMSGSFGALGGDLSALKINPAGSSIFLANRASFSFGVPTFSNDVTFNNNTTSYRNNSFDLGQGGAVFVFNNRNEAASVTKFSFGITYDKTASYDNRIRAIGTGNTSIANHFVNIANGVPLDLFTARENESLADLYSYLGTADFSQEGYINSRLQSAYLAYEAFVFDSRNPDNMSSTRYVSNVTGNSFDQTYREIKDGFSGKISANASVSINDRFYFGSLVGD